MLFIILQKLMIDYVMNCLFSQNITTDLIMINNNIEQTL